MKGGIQRRLATGANAVLVAFLVIGITGALVDLAERYRVRWDLTQGANATLQPETLAVVDAVDARAEPIQVTAFTAQRKNREAAYRDRMMRDFLAELAYRSARISFRLVDFDRDRLTAERLGVDRYGTVVIEGLGDRVDIIDRELFRHRGKGEDRELEFLGEAAIARGIRQLLADRQHRIYVLTGHGERTLFDRGIGELVTLAALIDNEGWTSRPLDLLADREDALPPAVPDDASAVILLGPRHPLTAREDAALREYLGRGGSVGYFVDPGGTRARWLDEVGVLLPDGVVLSEEHLFPGPERPLLRARSHAITRVLLEDALRVEVAHARPVSLLRREGVVATPLLEGGRRAWLERGGAPEQYDEGIDGTHEASTVAVAVGVARPHPMVRSGSGRLVVVGDVDIVGDEGIDEAPGNRSFVLNALRWLVRADERIARVGRPGRIRRVAMTPEQLLLVKWLVMGLLPLLTVLVGGAVRVARRRT